MKARQAFDRALALINERDSGGAYHADVVDFEKNAPEIINSIVTLLWLDECIIRKISPRDFSWDFQPIRTLDDEIPLHEALASGVLPYAIASHLIFEEDSGRAEYFYSLFKNTRSEVVAAFASATHGSVVDVY